MGEKQNSDKVAMHKLTAPLLRMGATEDDADIRHASGFTAPDPFLFWGDGAQKILLVSRLESGRALAACDVPWEV